MSDTVNISLISDTSVKENIVYDTESVSKILGVQESTVRKYCGLMQKYHYQFNKNAVGHRIFYKKDIDVIRKILELKNSSELTLNEAVKVVLESDDIEDVSSIKDMSFTPEFNKLMEEFRDFKKQQTEFNEKLFEQLKKQEEYISHSIEERDTKLLIALKETLETRRQLAAAEEQKRKWWRFWS